MCARPKGQMTHKLYCLSIQKFQPIILSRSPFLLFRFLSFIFLLTVYMIPLFLLISSNELILCRDIYQVPFCAFMDRGEDEIHNSPLDQAKNSTMITILWKKASNTRHTECFPFTKKIRKFRSECKWKGYFGLPDRKISGEINGMSSEAVQNSQLEYLNGKCAFCLLFSTSSRPFGLSSSRWRCPWKWNTNIRWKYLLGVLMRPIYCHFRHYCFSDKMVNKHNVFLHTSLTSVAPRMYIL